jgi:hypothetical protein
MKILCFLLWSRMTGLYHLILISTSHNLDSLSFLVYLYHWSNCNSWLTTADLSTCKKLKSFSRSGYWNLFFSFWILNLKANFYRRMTAEL